MLTETVTLSGDHVRRLLGSNISNCGDRFDSRTARARPDRGPRRGTTPLEGDTTVWEIPSYRQDLRRPVDLIEEVARVAGLEGVPSRMVAQFASPGAADDTYDFALGLKLRLASAGFSRRGRSNLFLRSNLGRRSASTAGGLNRSN